MEQLVKERRPLRKLFSKFEKELKEALEAEEKETEVIVAKLKLLTDTFEKLLEVDLKFSEFIRTNPVSEEKEDEELEGQAQFKLQYEVIKVKVEKFQLNNANTTMTTESVHDGASAAGGEFRQRNFKLPQVQIPKFSGRLTEWISYWAQFQKIHEDEFMSSSDKFIYLLQSLEPGTDAFKIASRFPQSNENYALAVDALKKKFGNPDVLLEVYVREILGLIVANFTAKDKIPLKDLYLSLDTQIQSLQTLKLEKADPSIWLYPLVEACLPKEVLCLWKRIAHNSTEDDSGGAPKNRLQKLMLFMENEVDIRDGVERTETFSEKTCEKSQAVAKFKRGFPATRPAVPTMAGFHAGSIKQQRCFFCNGRNHDSPDCFKAKSMNLYKKRQILKRNNLCFDCFGPHRRNQCDNDLIKCKFCGSKHQSLMCPDNQRNEEREPKRWQKRQRMESDTSAPEKNTSCSNQTCAAQVALQTVNAKISQGDKVKAVRVFLDCGSQRTYVLKNVTSRMQLQPKSMERVVHSLFGGEVTKPTNHMVYNLTLSNVNGDFAVTVNVREQVQLCCKIPNITQSDPEIQKELTARGISLSDHGDEDSPIEVLVGNDLYGKLLTGRSVHLDCGLTAIETKFGWTLSGEVEKIENVTAIYMDMSVTDATIAQLWELDRIGIRDSMELHTAKEREQIVKSRFIENVGRNQDGRYCVKLPWKHGHPPLLPNKEIAFKRLQTTIKKLSANGMLEHYGRLFDEWEAEGFIERVHGSPTSGHYIPHRPVIKKDSTTTPVRPVFDASCKTAKSVSLNDCLEKGPNLIQLLPEVLLRFRLKRVGFVSDIRKAFQMIEVAEEDRDFMRFLWCKAGNSDQLIEYRHARVMFGATSSPFILMAVLEHYLKSLPEGMAELGQQLWQSFYVDNCVWSTDCQADYRDFRESAVEVLRKVKMDLRMWFSNVDLDFSSSPLVPVLGLVWNRERDTLSVKLEVDALPSLVTKRVVLSVVQKVFDPVGFCCPALIPMKHLLQKTWIQKLKWDEPLPEAEEKLFRKWIAELPELKEIEIPRLATDGDRDQTGWSLQTFVDASSIAYAAAVFLRCQSEEKVTVQLVAAKGRVAPLQCATIPRLELLACLIGSRLAASVKRTINAPDIPEVYWSDSTTALAWIARKEPWGSWVGNRVQEVRKLTEINQWRHVPGSQNPADLPSRGCTPAALKRSEWWNGPDWLKLNEEEWPSEISIPDEEEIFKEQRRSQLISAIALQEEKCIFEEYSRQFSFRQQVRIVSWMRRFLHNARQEKNKRKSGPLTHEETTEAEIVIWRKIQQHYFPEKRRDDLKGLEVVTDENGILRVKTRIIHREDVFDFKYPILVPGKSTVVRQLIQDTHRSYCHAGVGFLMTKLRQRYWILKMRKSIKSVTDKCIRCRRFSAKPITTATAPLPPDRVNDGEVFQTIGVDLAGPLLLKNGKKVWLVIFTCALYRAVHFGVVSNLSAKAFIVALKQFISRYRRPDVIFCDNGTNFHGAANLFRKLDWEKIKEEEDVKPITYKHSPPISAWWGGWWERLIGTAKNLMKRSIGKATLNRSELEKLLVHIADVMNERPLTYVSEDPRDLEPLTPSHFLHPLGVRSFPEEICAEPEKLRRRLNYIRTLQKELKDRFRREYLSMLVSRNKKKSSRELKVGDLVIVGSDNQKRLLWPMGRILELFPGRDNVCRVARVKTAEGELTRAVQRLYPLEMDTEEENRKVVRVEYKTRAGRLVKAPSRLM